MQHANYYKIAHPVLVINRISITVNILVTLTIAKNVNALVKLLIALQQISAGRSVVSA